MTTTIKLLPPIMPNFIPYILGEKTAHVAITNLSKEEAIAYGELMKDAFIAHWEKKKSFKETL